MHGQFLFTNKQNKFVTQGAMNDVKTNFKNHKFELFTDSKSFIPVGGEKAKSQPTVGGKKTKPNEKCPCGTGKKFKKCCMNK